MKIALITGSYPPETCGIGDYTCCLANALQNEGVAVEVVHKLAWRMSNIAKIIASIRAMRPDIVHIQYPSVGYGMQLTPQLLSMAIPCVVTIHEVSEAHPLRKIALFPFSIRSKHIVFTTAFERSYSVARAPWLKACSSVIPIGSNISVSPSGDKREQSEIIYFGLFRPDKGLEDVFALAGLIQARSLPFAVRIIGKPYPADSPYFREYYERSLNMPIRWNIDCTDDAVAALLARSSVAYMPFPDGASGRRGSLMALLANGVVTMTTRGAHTPAGLADAVLFVNGPDEALGTFTTMRADPKQEEELRKHAYSYASQFSWPLIAQQHIDLYKHLLESCP